MYDFAYHKPSTVADAVAMLAADPDAKPVSGGHTLLPALKHRLNKPTALIDISGIAELKGIRREGNSLIVGALCTHNEVATSDVVMAAIPSLASMASHIGDTQVRNRGTMGGSVANNDPAADYPSAVLALGATIHTSKRKIAADDFFQGMFTTALADGEIVRRVGFKVPTGAAYAKFRHPASRYAVVGVFAARFGAVARVAVIGAGACVFRWAEAEAALGASFAPAAVKGMTLDAADLNSDIHASAEFRAHLAGVMLAQAVGEA